MSLGLADAKLVLEAIEKLNTLATKEDLMSLAEQVFGKLADLQSGIDAVQDAALTKIAALELTVAALKANPSATETAEIITQLEGAIVDLKSTFPAAPTPVDPPVDVPPVDTPADPAPDAPADPIVIEAPVPDAPAAPDAPAPTA